MAKKQSQKNKYMLKIWTRNTDAVATYITAERYKQLLDHYMKEVIENHENYGPDDTDFYITETISVKEQNNLIDDIYQIDDEGASIQLIHRTAKTGYHFSRKM